MAGIPGFKKDTDKKQEVVFYCLASRDPHVSNGCKKTKKYLTDYMERSLYKLVKFFFRLSKIKT